MKNILFGITIGYLGRDAIDLFLKGFSDRIEEAKRAREAKEAQKEAPKDEGESSMGPFPHDPGVPQ